MRRFGLREMILAGMSLGLLGRQAASDDKPAEKEKASDPKTSEEKKPEAQAPGDTKDSKKEAKKEDAKKEDASKADEKKAAAEKKSKKDEAAKAAPADAAAAKAVPAGELLKVLKGAETKAAEAVEGAARAVEGAKEAKEKVKAVSKAGEAVEVKLDEAPTKPNTEKKDGEKKDAKAAKKPPEPPMFRLRDGTRLAGTPELKSLNIRTAYGKLVIPIVEVIRMRFAVAEDTAIAGRVADQVKALSSEEFDKREEAMAAIRDIGVPALQALKKAAESDDEEVKSRAEKLVGEIEESMEEAEGEEALLGVVSGEEDEIVTLKFTVRGRVEEEKFALATRYGALSLSRNDIVSVLFQEGPNTKVTFTVPGATFAAGNKWVDTKLAVTQGQRLHITASGQLNLENYGQTTGPEGTTNISGNQLETHPSGALVGKIGNGKAFLIGSEYEGNANASGTLQLGVSLNQGQVSGQYQVDVEKEGES